MKKKIFTLATMALIGISSLFAQKTSDNNVKLDWKTEISSNYFYIRIAESPTKYWDLPGGHPETANKNIQFQVWDKFDEPFERTFIFPKINGTENYAIKNKAGYIVDIGGKTALNPKEEMEKKLKNKKFKMKKDNGAEVQTWTYDNGVAEWQQWRLIIVDAHIVMFESVYTGKAIYVDGGIFTNGNKLVMQTRTNGPAQKFVLEYAEGPKKGQLLSFE